MARRDTQYEQVETVDNGLGPTHFIRLKSGRQITYWDAMRAVESAATALGTGFSRLFKLAVAQGKEGDGMFSMSQEYYLETLEYRIDQVEEHMAALRAYLEKLRGSQSKRDRIKALRNVEGRTPGEAAAFLAKADQLERELDA